MAAWRRAIELSLGEADTAKLRSIAQSRTEPASRVERARILLAYREDPSFFAVGRALGLHHQTVQRCVERAVAEGPLAALDDRPRPGREPTITPEAKAWLVSLACRKAKELGYPHELWTTRLLARHAREHGPAEGHACLANLAQGTVCKILDQEEVKPHKVRYYLEQRDPDFAEKMAEVLCVYRQVKILKQAAAVSKKKLSDAMAIISYDEKPGIQAIATTAPDLPPEPGVHATFAREHEYKRHGTISLLACIDLVTGKVHALVKDRHRSREFIEFLKLLDAAYPAHTTQIEETTSDYDREKLQERLAKLAGGVAVIRVGGATEVEVKERKDRVDDAMHATRAAVEEGILPGGGVALLRAAEVLKRVRTSNEDQKHGVDIVRKALSWPARQIALNAGEDGSVVVGKILEKDTYGFGFDAQSGEYVNMMSKGIIDPTKVVRAALQGAASVAGLLITTEAMVAELPKKESPAMPGGGGMGGMGGMDY